MKATVTSYSGSGNTRPRGASGGQRRGWNTLSATATDHGEPGKGSDFISITLSSSGFYYHAEGYLDGGGNIQLHA